MIESPRPLHKNNAPLHLTNLARALGTDFEVLKELNPEILGYYLRAGHYRIKVPAGLGVRLPSALGHFNRQASRRLERSATRHYVVQSGETAKEIARKTGVRLAVLIRLNDLDGMALIAG